MSLGSLKETGWIPLHNTNAHLFRRRPQRARSAPKRCKDFAAAELNACPGHADNQCSASSTGAHAEQERPISRRHALGGLASGLTLLSMPASAEDQAAGL